MIKPGIVSFEGSRDRGFDVTIIIEVDDVPMDLTGLVIESDIKKEMSHVSATESFTLTRTDLEGKIVYSLTATQMKALEVAKYVFDTKVTDGIKEPDNYVKGTFHVRDTVT
jgi:hypothetical protein